MNIMAKMSPKMLLLVAAIALLMTGVASGTLSGKNDTQVKRINAVNQASRSWFETLSWEEREAVLYPLEPDVGSGSCQKELVIRVFNLDSDLLAEFVAYKDSPIKDKALRALMYRSDYLMSLDNEMYFVLFE